jgi:DNA-directed RNA polymerase specialized sigma54-like protein
MALGRKGSFKRLVEIADGRAQELVNDFDKTHIKQSLKQVVKAAIESAQETLSDSEIVQILNSLIFPLRYEISDDDKKEK